MAGIFVANFGLFSCIQEGYFYQNNKDFRDLGECVGKLYSLVLDA